MDFFIFIGVAAFLATLFAIAYGGKYLYDKAVARNYDGQQEEADSEDPVIGDEWDTKKADDAFFEQALIESKLEKYRAGDTLTFYVSEFPYTLEQMEKALKKWDPHIQKIVKRTVWGRDVWSVMKQKQIGLWEQRRVEWEARQAEEDKRRAQHEERVRLDKERQKREEAYEASLTPEQKETRRLYLEEAAAASIRYEKEKKALEKKAIDELYAKKTDAQLAHSAKVLSEFVDTKNPHLVAVREELARRNSPAAALLEEFGQSESIKPTAIGKKIKVGFSIDEPALKKVKKAIKKLSSNTKKAVVKTSRKKHSKARGKV